MVEIKDRQEYITAVVVDGGSDSQVASMIQSLENIGIKVVDRFFSSKDPRLMDFLAQGDNLGVALISDDEPEAIDLVGRFLQKDPQIYALVYNRESLITSPELAKKRLQNSNNP